MYLCVQHITCGHCPTTCAYLPVPNARLPSCDVCQIRKGGYMQAELAGRAGATGVSDHCHNRLNAFAASLHNSRALPSVCK